MIRFGYVIPRIIRRSLPLPMISWAKSLRLGIEAGLETRQPGIAAERYLGVLQRSNWKLDGKRILILGYGGYFGLAVELLRRGAKHICLVDPYAQVDHRANAKLVDDSCQYLNLRGKEVIPNEEWITLYHESADQVDQRGMVPVDLIFSSSVLEHVDSLDALIQAILKLSRPDGKQIHFVDLRDHYFKYPFEMLCYSKNVWQSYLNPPSNLNRLREWDYEALFSKYFHDLQIEIIEKDPESFKRVKGRIVPEFISGNEDRDSATRILIKASYPVIS